MKHTTIWIWAFCILGLATGFGQASELHPYLTWAGFSPGNIHELATLTTNDRFKHTLISNSIQIAGSLNKIVAGSLTSIAMQELVNSFATGRIISESVVGIEGKVYFVGSTTAGVHEYDY